METRHKPKSEIERLLEYFQSDSDALDSLQDLDLSKIPGLSIMSMITYEGVPIVPPVVCFCLYSPLKPLSLLSVIYMYVEV